MNWKQKAQIGLLKTKRNHEYTIRMYSDRLAISRKDDAVMSWEELQNIKQNLLGDAFAIEVYPPADEVVNLRNTRHLWFGLGITATVEAYCRHAEFNNI
jgi:hypothetical protein